MLGPGLSQQTSTGVRTSQPAEPGHMTSYTLMLMNLPVSDAHTALGVGELSATDESAPHARVHVALVVQRLGRMAMQLAVASGQPGWGPGHRWSGDRTCGPRPHSQRWLGRHTTQAVFTCQPGHFDSKFEASVSW